MGSSLTRHAIAAGPEADVFVLIHRCFSDLRFIHNPSVCNILGSAV